MKKHSENIVLVRLLLESEVGGSMMSESTVGPDVGGGLGGG